MCYVLNAEKILFNYFAAKSDKKKISYNNLSELSCKIVRDCNNGIIVRINRDEIDNVIMKWPKVFKLNGSAILLEDQENILIKHIDIFNRNMPQDVAKKCIKACKSYVEQ